MYTNQPSSPSNRTSSPSEHSSQALWQLLTVFQQKMTKGGYRHSRIPTNQRPIYIRGGYTG